MWADDNNFEGLTRSSASKSGVSVPEDELRSGCIVLNECCLARLCAETSPAYDSGSTVQLMDDALLATHVSELVDAYRDAKKVPIQTHFDFDSSPHSCAAHPVLSANIFCV